MKYFLVVCIFMPIFNEVIDSVHKCASIFRLQLHFFHSRSTIPGIVVVFILLSIFTFRFFLVVKNFRAMCVFFTIFLYAVKCRIKVNII